MGALAAAEGDEVFDWVLMSVQIVYVSLHPPEKGDTEVCSADQWRLDLGELEKAFSNKTRMIVSAPLLAGTRFIY